MLRDKCASLPVHAPRLRHGGGERASECIGLAETLSNVHLFSCVAWGNRCKVKLKGPSEFRVTSKIR